MSPEDIPVDDSQIDRDFEDVCVPTMTTPDKCPKAGWYFTSLYDFPCYWNGINALRSGEVWLNVKDWSSFVGPLEDFARLTAELSAAQGKLAAIEAKQQEWSEEAERCERQARIGSFSEGNSATAEALNRVYESLEEILHPHPAP